MEDSLGTKFLSKSEVVETFPLKENYITCIYISAKWCPLCVTFTPILLDFYHEINIEEKLLEIIYVSRDKTKDEFEDFYKEMPWLAFPFGDSRVKKLIDAHDVKGIPMLIVLKRNGEAATVHGKKDIMTESYEAFNKWVQIIGKKNE